MIFRVYLLVCFYYYYYFFWFNMHPPACTVWPQPLWLVLKIQDSWIHFLPHNFTVNLISPRTFDPSTSCSESPPHRFGGLAPLDPLGVLRVTCVWGVGTAVFAVSWLSYVHPAVLAESLTTVWQLRQGATWERTGRHDDENLNLNS